MESMPSSKPQISAATWKPGVAPVAVILISLNEEHNIKSVLNNLKGWANEVFLVDSFSSDDTVSIALDHGVHVVQRTFRGFGNQWNFALEKLPIKSPWVMKLDPDERLSPELKSEITRATADPQVDGIIFFRRWWLMSQPLPIGDYVLRVWRAGRCRFSDVSVNEHPTVAGRIVKVRGFLEHHDSPDLDHWFDKQNRYSTAEAINAYRGAALADVPRLFGSQLQRRMWIKRNFERIPFRHQILFFYYWAARGLWRAGSVGYIAARLWADVWRFREYKQREMRLTGNAPLPRRRGNGLPDVRVQQYE